MNVYASESMLNAGAIFEYALGALKRRITDTVEREEVKGEGKRGEESCEIVKQSKLMVNFHTHTHTHSQNIFFSFFLISSHSFSLSFTHTHTNLHTLVMNLSEMTSAFKWGKRLGNGGIGGAKNKIQQ